MKRLLLFLFSLALLTGCAEEEEFSLDNGIILGRDNRFCGCCGGWFIEINDTQYLFKELPAGSGFEISDNNLPQAVSVSWEQKENACLPNEIIIVSIKEQ